MNLTKERRKHIAKAEKITEAITSKLKSKKEEISKKVDLGKIAKEMSLRREKVLNLEKEKESKEK